MRETILKKMATSMRYAWVALAMTTLASRPFAFATQRI